MKLDVPVHFVAHRSHFWPEISEGRYLDVDDELLSRRCVGAVNNWIMQPIVLFAREGLTFTASPDLRADCINIVSGIDFGIRDRDIDSFLLALRADGHSPQIANFVGEQNGLSRGKNGIAFMPHLPQPNLIARDAARGTRVEVASFKGALSNLHEDLRSQYFKDALSEVGINLRLDLRPKIASQSFNDRPIKMHDYHEVDVVVAIRNLTMRDYAAKPASKLVNAWLAGVPAVLGPEPAFRELRTSNLDYLEVRSAEEALNALRNLKSNPELYSQMVENGASKRPAHDARAVIKRWVDTLNGPVKYSFERWHGTNRIYKLGRWGVTAGAEKLSKFAARRRRNKGPRGPGVSNDF